MLNLVVEMIDWFGSLISRHPWMVDAVYYSLGVFMIYVVFSILDLWRRKELI